MIFVDSSAFIALLVSEDDHHAAATKYHRAMKAQRWTLDSIIGETYTHLRYRFGKSTSLAFLDTISQIRASGDLRIACVDSSLSAATEGVIRQYSDIPLSYVDASALAWLRLHPEIREIFGFDQHWCIEGHLLAPVG